MLSLAQAGQMGVDDGGIGAFMAGTPVSSCASKNQLKRPSGSDLSAASRWRLNEPRLTLNPGHRSDSLGIESVGTNSGNGGNALFHPKRASAALVSFRGI
jgi:hypothetical protein